jgi:hypothetical protein
MASSINASTSAGLVSTADTSGVLQLQTAGTTAVTVDTAQNVGIGTTPAAMFSSARALQLGAGTILEGRSASSTVSTLSSNQYINTSSARTYITSDYASYYTQINGQHQFQTAPSGTAGTTATFTQVLALNKDQTVALQGASLQNGCGITFPATQVSSSNANTLDDYEEGTWTPTLSATGAFTSLTYSSQQGNYVKIGSFVYATFFVQINAVSGGSGTMLLGGAPFATASSGPNPGGYVSLVTGWTTNNPSTFDASGSSTTDYNIFYRSTSNGVTSSLTSSAAAASAYIRGTLYFYTNT